MKTILGLVGEIASGKGTVAKYLHEKYESNTYRFSTMLRDIMNRLYLPVNRNNLQSISTLLREQFGQDVMSRVIAKDVENDRNDLVVVDGIRRPTDITYLRKIHGFHLVSLIADPHLRWQRLVARDENEGDAKKTFEEFIKNGEAEAETLIIELNKEAEYTIDNNGVKEQLFSQVEDMLTSMGYSNRTIEQ